MSSFQFLYNYGGSDVDITGSGRNVVGAPIVYDVELGALVVFKLSDYAIENLNPIPGIYRFTVESAATVSCRRAHAWDRDNPLIFSGDRTVFVGEEPNYWNANLLPGWTVSLKSDMQAGDEFEIGVGCIWDATAGRWQRVLSFGPVVAGFQGSARELKIVNATDGTLTDCMLVATNAIRVENDPALVSEPLEGFSAYGLRPFDQFYQTGILNPEADTDLNGAAVSFDNYAAGDPPTVDILIDGAPIDVYDTVAEALIPRGTGLNCDGAAGAGTVYRFADGTKYQGGTFILSAGLQETDTASIFVSDGGGAVWLADATGVFVRGAAGLTITEDGQEAGTVTASGEVEISLSVRPPAAATTSLNERSFSLRAVGGDGSENELCDERQGSFLVAQGDGELSVRITAIEAAYYRPRYTEDGEPDDEGNYVEDLSNPGTFIVLAEAPNGGQYGSVWDYLEENGVIMEEA